LAEHVDDSDGVDTWDDVHELAKGRGVPYFEQRLLESGQCLNFSEKDGDHFAAHVAVGMMATNCKEVGCVSSFDQVSETRVMVAYSEQRYVSFGLNQMV
jgi:hypothetical protein